MRYIKGSEWRKWDLHIHTPVSINQNYGGESAWDNFIDALEHLPEEVRVIGITDYYFIDGYEKVMNYKKQGRLQNIDKIFPVLEFRIDTFGSGNVTELQKINLHILFDLDESNLKEEIENVKKEFIGIIPISSAEKYSTKMLSKKNFINISGNLQKGFSEIIPPTKVVLSVAKSDTWKNRTALFLGYKEWSNLEKNQQLKPLKEELYNKVDAFFTSNSTNIVKNQLWLNEYGNKRLLHSGDIHSFTFLDTAIKNESGDYIPSKNYNCLTWLKADPTFEGLKQCTYQPDERIYIGVLPPLLDRVQKKKQFYIKSISVTKLAEAKNKEEWFNFEIPLNPSLVAIIGNKGSGKSALSDIIACLCKNHSAINDDASFLNKLRFKKPPKKYSADYVGSILWTDGHQIKDMCLDINEFDTSIESAQYLPQKYIERICNDLGDVFQKEINKVIFSYIDSTDKGNSSDLDELIGSKSSFILHAIEEIKSEIHSINKGIILLENKKTNMYRKNIQENLDECKNLLERHEKNKPIVVEKPTDNAGDNKSKNIDELNEKIEQLKIAIQSQKDMLKNVNDLHSKLNGSIEEMNYVQKFIDEQNDKLALLTKDLNLPDGSLKISVIIPILKMQESTKLLTEQKLALLASLDVSENASPEISLVKRLSLCETERNSILEQANASQKAYQKYLCDEDEWEKSKNKILGNSTTEGTIRYYEAELNYLDEDLEKEYQIKRAEREEKIKLLYEQKKQIRKIYSDIYAPVSIIIAKLLAKVSEEIKFKAELELINKNIGVDLLSQINKSYSGTFGRNSDAQKQMDDFIASTDFNDENSVIEFVNNVLKVVDENIDLSEKRVKSKEEFYDKLCHLDYLDVNYSLKVENKSLEELSPGERGLVLLIFYLGLSKDDVPIIIDQPEDNLDNESIYLKLVSCICQAKRNRQVIIVTHNPNIAIACDAEQIIYCSINKINSQISYESGSIENEEIKNHLIDVLEGTEPAFCLRKTKYEI